LNRNSSKFHRAIFGKARQIRVLLRALSVSFSLVVFAFSAIQVDGKGTNLDPSRTQLCYNAISHASHKLGVPKDVLLAISLTETGKKLGGQIHPWPWTVNMEGKGDWFSDQHSALSYVKKRYSQGVRSFDVGCFQINYRWHHQHFRTIEDMFDPITNATYAAEFLKNLYLETGSWVTAAGYYHSRTPEFANRYRERFSKYRERLALNNLDLPVFAGHGSETLAMNSGGSVRSNTRTYAPLLKLGQIEVPKSARISTQGSLFQSQDRSQSLLRRSRRSLF